LPFFGSLIPFRLRRQILDISFKMLKRAKKYRHLDLVLGDARMLPFKAQCFDAVLAVDSLHHVRDYPGVLKEVSRIGKAGFEWGILGIEIHTVPYSGDGICFFTIGPHISQAPILGHLFFAGTNI
jgi:ubiquinone/menaquinone biosynthesis C-methylase UbiE